MDQIKGGIVHTHTEGSIKDSALKAKDLCKRAQELGAPAVVLTDHGVLTRVFEFMKAAKEYNIKGIPGVEAYVQEDDELSKRSHLVLIPKNYNGYKAICNAVTKSNTRLNGYGIPRMNLEILQQCFGPKSKGHGDVIATSACVNGILAQILLKNEYLDREQLKIKERMVKLSDPNDPAYKSNKELLETTHKKIEKMMEERDALNKIANRKFSAKERKINTLKENGSEDYEKEKSKLEQEKRETAQAAEKVAKIKTDIAKTKRQETAIRKQCREAEKTHQQWLDYQKLIDKIEASKRTDAELMDEAKELANTMVLLFGSGNFYVELQNHGIAEEAIVMPKLAQIADTLNLPVVACNDVHYANNSKNDVRARQIVRSLRFNKFEPLNVGDSEYYIKTDEELTKALKEILDSDTVDKAMQGIRDIVDQCNVEFPAKTHFPEFKSDDGEDAKTRLRRLAQEGIALRFPNGGFTEEYQKRLEYELEIIEKLDYCDYLCIVEDFLRYGRKLGTDNAEGVGLGVGPGRGSAVGSLVCYLSGITGVDPIQYGLLFERFLNSDRVSYPDIDSDFGTDIREEVLEYVKKKYGEEAVCNIMTQGTLAARAAIRNVARIHGDEKYGDTKALLGKGDSIARAIPETVGVKLKDVEEDLRKQFAGDKDALDILDDAKLVEGTTIQYGMHAAGVIIADNGHVGEYVPLMYNEDKGQWMCQCTMGEAEENAGLLKMDFLGLRNLNIITDTLKLIKRNRGISIDMEEVGRSLINDRDSKYDINGNVFDKIFATGKTNAVFQFESPGMKAMLKKFKPSNINDIILLIACFRPGPLQFLDDIILVKHGRKTPTYIIPELKDILDSTYGHPVYQEQVMHICNNIAGFSLGKADIIRRAMSKKKMSVLAKYHDDFIAGFMNAGANESDSEKFWEQLMEFSRYAFNKSHACAYAFVAYYTAWLKLNYPAEYMTAVLNYSVTEKYPMFITECNEMGIRVLPPDINQSDIKFTCRGNEILFGLGNVKNVKNAANGIIEQRGSDSFHSFKDYISRARTKKDVTESLIDAGAMDCWCSNRLAMKESLEELEKDYKKAMDKLAIVSKEKEEIKEVTNEKEHEKKQKRIETAETKYREYLSRFNRAMLPVYLPENKLERLQAENELLGMYVSGHPLDEYEDVKRLRSCLISEAEEGIISLSGMICEVRFTQRKKDGAPMAFFQLKDESGSIDICCFTDAFSKFKKLVTDGNVVVIKGKCVLEKSLYDDEDMFKLHVQNIKPVKRTLQKIIISVKDMMDWADRVYDMVLRYSGNDYTVIIHDKMTGEFRQTVGIAVDASLLEADIPNCDIELFNQKEHAA